MKEEEVHPLSKQWLLDRGFDSYKGVCNKGQENGSGDVPVPTVVKEKVKIDHMGEKRTDIAWVRLWIEDKGSNANLSTLLEGFSRVCFAIFYGGGDALLSVPHDRIKVIEENEEFFKQLANVTVGKGRAGILDVEKGKEQFY